MSALLGERSKRQQVPGSVSKTEGEKSLDSLVESVKRKSHTIGENGIGKRRKLAPK